MKQLLNKLITMSGILLIITLAWQTLEIMYYGENKPNQIDGIIAIVLTYSLYCNLKIWNKK